MLQVNIKSIGRKRFARLSDNKAEIHVRKNSLQKTDNWDDVRKNSRSQSIKKTYNWDEMRKISCSQSIKNDNCDKVDENMPWGSDALFTLQFVEESRK